MTHKKPTQSFTRNILHLATFGAMCGIASFVLGIKTAGDVQPFTQSEAAIEHSVDSQSQVSGDLNANGILDLQDVIGILEYAESLDSPSADVISRGDLDGDYLLTAKDAMRILRTLSLR